MSVTSELLASITRCNAVYETNELKARTAFVNMGCAVIGWYSTNTAQAAALRLADGSYVLCIAGTRVTNSSTAQAASDIWEDAEEIFSNHNLGGGAIVASGAFARGTEVWNWAKTVFPADAVVNVEGHSLGGQDTHAMLCIMPPSVIGTLTAWEPPKAGNDAFWAQYGAGFLEHYVTTVINGADPWAAHPWISHTLRHPPGPILWLHDSTWSWTTRETWPGGQALHASDHDTDQVMRAVAACL